MAAVQGHGPPEVRVGASLGSFCGSPGVSQTDIFVEGSAGEKMKKKTEKSKNNTKENKNIYQKQKQRRTKIKKSAKNTPNQNLSKNQKIKVNFFFEKKKKQKMKKWRGVEVPRSSNLPHPNPRLSN